MPGSVVIASLVTSVVSNTIQRVLRSPVVLTKKGKNSKGKGKNGKVVQFGGRHVQKCFRYLRGKCEKGKDCGFTHNKDDPSKGDLEVQRRMAEKKTRESSGRDAVTGVVLGGDRLKVCLRLLRRQRMQRLRIGSGTPAQPLM